VGGEVRLWLQTLLSQDIKKQTDRSTEMQID
jgi:hypothetical protein